MIQLQQVYNHGKYNYNGKDLKFPFDDDIKMSYKRFNPAYKWGVEYYSPPYVLFSREGGAGVGVRQNWRNM